MRVLQHTLSRRFRGLLSRTLNHPLKSLCLGVAATGVVQASSITVMSAMGMVGTTLITLEQGYFLMLGATLGTTLKIWVLGFHALVLGPPLVGATSLALLVVRRKSLRDGLEGLLAIGLALWGMLLIEQGLTPLLDLPDVRDSILGNPGKTLADQATGVLMGLLFAACLQSGSTVVSLMLLLGAAGQVNYAFAAAIIIGANVGTTTGPLLASLEHGANLRRLALAHFLVKLFGALITLLFFPQFISFWVWLIPPLSTDARTLSLRLAATHTGFNLVNVIGWSLLSALMLRLVNYLIPSRSLGPSLALAPVVRKILGRSPERSRQEALRQLDQLLVCVKSLLDQGASLLSGARTSETRLESRLLEQAEFEGLKESTYELLVQASPGQADDLRELLTRLSDLEELHFQATRLRDQLEQGLIKESLELPQGLAGLAEPYRLCLDETWLRLLFPGESLTITHEPDRLGDMFENEFYSALSQADEMTPLQASWTFEMVSSLRCVLLHLAAMIQARHYSTLTSSTSNISVAPGGMTPPAPASP